MKKIYMLILLFLTAIFIFYINVFAEENIKIMQVQSQKDIPSVFVKGIEGDIKSTDAIIGNIASNQIRINPVISEQISMKTLVLIDNSLSIPNEDRKFLKDILIELFASRGNNEQYALATYGEDIEMLVDYTDDYNLLKVAVNEIVFQNRETYLTDVLYDLIENRNFVQDEELVYKRIFIISDGVDNKSLGYTKEELTEILKKTNVPLYMLGVYNKKKTNSDELSNMFALSRQTHAASFLLSDLEKTETIIDVLAQDRDIVRFDIELPSEVKDGSKKTITLNIHTITESAELKIDSVRMPQEVIETGTPVVEESQIEEKTSEVESDFESVDNDKEFGSTAFIVLLLIEVSVVMVVLILILVLIPFLKKKKRENELNEVEDPFILHKDEDKTEWTSIEYNGLDGKTLQIFDTVQRRSCVIILTDVISPVHSFQKTITDRLVIGRSPTSSDICIDYEKSVSSKHCAIERKGDKFFLVDLQSSNGTFLDGNKVLSEVEIFSGCIIKMGRVQMRFEIG